MSTPQDGAGTKPAPEGDAVTAPRHPAFPWPSSEDPREWPDDDAPAVEWAVFYRDRLGREVWPTPSRFDVIALAGHLRDKAVDAYVEDHGALPDDETQATLYEFAVEQAEDSVRGPCGWALAKAKRIVVGDAEFRSWWTSSAPTRSTALPPLPLGSNGGAMPCNTNAMARLGPRHCLSDD